MTFGVNFNSNWVKDNFLMFNFQYPYGQPFYSIHVTVTDKNHSQIAYSQLPFSNQIEKLIKNKTSFTHLWGWLLVFRIDFFQAFSD